MPTRTIVYNFIKEQAQIIQTLVEQGVIEIVEWFCYPPFGTVNIKHFADVQYRVQGTFGLGEEVYNRVFQSFPVFLDMQQRRYPYFQNTFYDLLNDFNRQFGAVYSLLTERRPQLVLFSNVPHGGHDLLLYEVARALSMRTLILFQVPVCPRFFMLENLEDFGVFGSCANSDDDPALAVPEIRTPFYAQLPAKKPGTLLRDLKSSTDKRIGPHVFIQRRRQQRYLTDLRGQSQELVPGTRFAYFPLHMQPEMTTSAIGGIYVDQLLAIERLARRLPPDIRIVVKENPKQTAYQRSHSFFERLAAIPNALLVPSDHDTYQFIRDSDFVATVTGTAGWEAINLGKATLVFGKAWYETLPGVCKYSATLDIPALAARQVDKEEVERAYRDLMGRAWPGIISSPYFKLSTGLDIGKNNSLVADALCKAIKKAYCNQNQLRRVNQ